jgi:hypothetical protein
MTVSTAHTHFTHAVTTYYNGRRYRVTLDARPNHTTGYQGRKTRVFVAGQPEPTFNHPPYGVRGADTDNDKAWARYNRAEITIMRHFAAAVVAPALKFSRHAGCSMCPCSPGFVVDDPNLQAMTLWVTVEPF